MKYKVATSLDSRKYYLSVKNVPAVLSLQREQDLRTDTSNRSDKIGKRYIATEVVFFCKKILISVPYSLHDNELGYDMEDDEDLSSTLDNQTLLRLLEEKEKVLYKLV